MTNRPGPLSPDQMEAYDRDGFVVVQSGFSEDELNALSLAADELAERMGPLTPDNPRARSEVEKVGGHIILRKVEPIIDVVPALETLVYDPRMTGPAAQIFGEDVFLFEDKLNYKPPLVGEKYDLHQDYAYWQDFTDRLITVTLLLDDATPENGCLRFIPGSHKNGLIAKENDHPRLITEQIDDPSITVDAPGQAGDLVVFSCYTAHHSFANRTDKGRRAVLYTYNPLSDGDTYATYKGAQAEQCRAWEAAQDS